MKFRHRRRAFERYSTTLRARRPGVVVSRANAIRDARANARLFQTSFDRSSRDRRRPPPLPSSSFQSRRAFSVVGYFCTKMSRRGDDGATASSTHGEHGGITRGGHLNRRRRSPLEIRAPVRSGRSTLTKRLDEPPEDEGGEWTLARTTKDGIKVWTRPAAKSFGARDCVKEIYAECVFRGVSRRAYWNAICDLERYGEFVPYVSTSRVLGKSGARTWCHAEIKMPMLKDRAYTIVIDDTSERGVNSGRWRTTREREPPLRQGLARMRANCGSWELRDCEDGSRGVRIRYSLVTDPGIDVPGFLLSQTPKTVPESLRAFRDRAKSGASEPNRRNVGDASLERASDFIRKKLCELTTESRDFASRVLKGNR